MKLIFKFLYTCTIGVAACVILLVAIDTKNGFDNIKKYFL